ncbi:hypothetical protein GpartN1_g6042.t1 [Galdieria partita]|uniref:cyclic pyranopterin monophosphate synthase n=1 Tax=Galdieria partita TaxID=83374 RepID=A0A9C7Q2F7_9RHOD|nr:hypothetical protein GpartN1_g6042.t1 [Galdieria partita]
MLQAPTQFLTGSRLLWNSIFCYSTRINAKENVESVGHIDERGNISMVDVSNKEITLRSATAEAKVFLGEEAYNKLLERTSWKHSGIIETAKGNLFVTAQIAGIQAAKKTSDWIPLCHPLQLQHVDVQLSLDREQHIINIRSTVKTKAETGAEMEALTAVSASALTVYDMCKSLSKRISIQEIQLLRKSGGKSGLYDKEIYSGK